jgi:AraC-like DNA-binding protein
VPSPPTPVRRASFASSDEGEVTDFIRRTYAENRSRFAPLRRGARFSALTHDTAVLGSDRLRTSIDYTGRSQGFDHYTFFVVHTGTVDVASPTASTVAGAGDVALYPLHVPIEFDMRHYDVTTVRLPAQRVAQVAEELTGVSGADLVFHDITPVSSPMRRYWRALTRMVSGALADEHSPLESPLLADDLARSVATAALHTFPNTTMTRQHDPGPGTVAPAAIRRAMAYLDGHAAEPVQLHEVAAAAGTSARALQYGFRRHLGTTPLGYLRRVRLEHSRRDLQAGDRAHGETVSTIAARWGFSNAGRFAAAYREAFGESPADTLAR